MNLPEMNLPHNEFNDNELTMMNLLWKIYQDKFTKMSLPISGIWSMRRKTEFKTLVDLERDGFH